MMNILHIYKTYTTDSFGGIEQVMHQICLATKKEAMHNRVLCLTHDKNLKPILQTEAEIFRCPINFEIAATPFSWKALRTFKQLTTWADVIHCHFPYPFADLLHFIIRPKKPLVITYHSDVVRQKFALLFYRPLQNYFLKAADKIIVTCPQYRQTSSVLQKFLDKTEVIPIGLDKSTYPVPTPEKLHYWQQRLGNQFFLFLGVMRYYKGLQFLLQAAQGVSAKIVLAGTGPLENSLKAQAKALKLQNIVFLGAVSEEDKVALLRLSLGMVFPSHLRSEAFGVSLLEAAMYGKPLISAEIGTGTTYINIHGETGLIVPPADPDALRQAMLYLQDNSTQATTMGQAAEKRYWELFTAREMGERYVQLYRSFYDFD